MASCTRPPVGLQLHLLPVPVQLLLQPHALHLHIRLIARDAFGPSEVNHAHLDRILGRLDNDGAILPIVPACFLAEVAMAA